MTVGDEVFVPPGVLVVGERVFVAVGSAIRVVKRLAPHENKGEYAQRR